MQKLEVISEKKESNNIDIILSSLKENKKSLPTKYLYDEKGSKLFEQICETKEYYLTRIEKKILSKYSSNIVNFAKAEEIFELGSGSSKKTKVLINEYLKKESNLTYSSLDISEKALNMSYKELEKLNKNLNINLIKGDFIKDLNKLKNSKKSRIYLFLGSTLGNFDNKLAISFLSNLSNIMKKNDFLLLGVDNVKDENIINSAYNDKLGVTKQFNKNILNVVNKKYNLNFEEDKFDHYAKYNVIESQIEMYLEAVSNQSIKLPNNETINIESGERILTEISRKFNKKTLNMLFKKANLKEEKMYTDDKNYFSLYLLKTKKYF